MTTTIEAPYGRMAWGLNSSNPDANEAWRKRMEHAATVMNRASDIFYAEAGHDLDRPFQWHPTHVQLAAAAVGVIAGWLGIKSFLTVIGTEGVLGGLTGLTGAWD